MCPYYGPFCKQETPNWLLQFNYDTTVACCQRTLCTGISLAVRLNAVLERILNAGWAYLLLGSSG